MTIDPSSSVAVFLGPSLPLTEARSRLAANYFPPIRMGDIYRLLATGIETIAIIDGVFHQSAPVWQREILSALEEGIRVVGGASMGALRAAELAPYGMEGVGKIYAWYRDGTIDGDDEVALIHVDATLGWQALSEPLVNIRHNLARAEARGLLSAAERACLIAAAQHACFSERSWQSLALCPEFTALPVTRKRALAEFLTSERVDLKREDALAVLDYCACRALPAWTPPPPAPWSFPGTVRPLRQCAVAADGVLVGGEQILRAALAADPDWAAVGELAARRDYLLLDWMVQRNVVPAPAALDTLKDALAPVAARTDLRAFLRANGLTQREYACALDARARLAWLQAQSPAALGLADVDNSTDSPTRWIHRILADWAALNGVLPPRDTWDKEDFGDWILTVGPAHFGHVQYSPDAALLRDLQMLGRCAEIVSAIRAGQTDDAGVT